MIGLIIHLGSTYPKYLTDSIDQFFLFNKKALLYCIVDSAFPELETKQQQYKNFKVVLTSSLKKSFNHKFFLLFNPYAYRKKKGVFWRYAIERLFYIEDFILTTGETNIVHFEGDNLIYDDIYNLTSYFQNNSKLAIAIDSDNRCIASVVCIPSLQSIKKFCSFYNKYFTILPKNDMISLAKFWQKKKTEILTLPVIPSAYAMNKVTLVNQLGEIASSALPYHENFNIFLCLFDAAAFGQYIGGVDPKNTNDPNNLIGFINEQSMYNPEDLPLIWKTNNEGLFRPYIEYPKSKFTPLFNLHIHSKFLHYFRSDKKR